MKRKWDGSGTHPLHKRVKYGGMGEYLSSRFLNFSRSELTVSTKAPERKEPREIVEFTGKDSKRRAVEARSGSFPGCAVFGQQIVQNVQRRKTYWKYLLASYASIANEENFRTSTYHEVILGPAKLVMDIDASIRPEDFSEGYRTSVGRLRSLVSAICEELGTDFGIECSWPTGGAPSGVIVLDASRLGKISFHVVFPKAIFESIVQAGCYVCKFLAHCDEGAAEQLRGILTAIDLNIYAKGHSLRTYYSINPFDLSSRMLLHGRDEQKFSRDVLLRSLVACTPERFDCIFVENVDSLKDSRHYRGAVERLRSPTAPKTRPPPGPRRPTRPSKVIQDLSDFGPNQKFFDIVGELAKQKDDNFTHDGTRITRCYLSNFGAQPTTSGAGPTPGPSYCMEVSGPYCLRHGKAHKKARIKTYFYFPYWDWTLARCVRKEKFDPGSVKNRMIYRLYYRCNYRNNREACARLDGSLVRGEFLEFHRKLTERLKKFRSDWITQRT